jgi:hypothetical protein
MSTLPRRDLRLADAFEGRAGVRLQLAPVNVMADDNHRVTTDRKDRLPNGRTSA